MRSKSWLAFLALPLLIKARFAPFYLLFLLPFSWNRKRGSGLFLFLIFSSIILLPVTSDFSQALFFAVSAAFIYVLFVGLNPENPEKFMNLFIFFLAINAIIEGIIKGGRAFTLLNDPNLAAVLMASSIPIASPILSVFAILGVAFTRSRAGLLIVLIALFFALKKRGKLALLIVVLLLLIIPNPLSGYLKNMNKDPFAFSRIKIWEKSLKILKEHPVGVGALNYSSWAAAYRIPVEGFPVRFFKTAVQAHNLFLQFIVELGPLGLIFIISLVWLVFKIKGKRRTVLLLLLMGAFFHSFELNFIFWLPFALFMEKGRKLISKRETFSGVFITSFIVFTIFFAGRYLAKKGEIFAYTLEFKKARHYFTIAEKLASYEPEVHISQAKAYLKSFEVFGDKEDLVKAILEAKKAQSLAKRNIESYLIEARALIFYGERFGLVPGDVRRIEKLYLKVFSLDPMNAFHRLELGEFFARLQQEEKAIFYIRQALSIEKNFLMARLDLYKLTGDESQLCYILRHLGEFKKWKGHPYIYRILFFPKALLKGVNLPSCPAQK